LSHFDQFCFICDDGLVDGGYIVKAVCHSFYKHAHAGNLEMRIDVWVLNLLVGKTVQFYTRKKVQMTICKYLVILIRAAFLL
jgi:hypothetical protein